LHSRKGTKNEQDLAARGKFQLVYWIKRRAILMSFLFWYIFFATSFLPECDQLRELKRLPITRRSS